MEVDKILNHIKQNYIGMKTFQGAIVDVRIAFGDCIILIFDGINDFGNKIIAHTICIEIETFYGLECDWRYVNWRDKMNNPQK